MHDLREPIPEFPLIVTRVTSLQQNASLLWSQASKEAVLIDPGGEVERLLDIVAEMQVRLGAIWLTHGHIDHVGGAEVIRERTGCKIFGPHPDDQFLLDQVEEHKVKYEIPEARNVKPDQLLQEGDQVTLDGLHFDVLHCPGHSPGHIVFVQREHHFAFVGDVLFRGSVGRTDLARSNSAQLVESITQKLWPLGGDMKFLPGHGPGSTIGRERKVNPYVSDSALGIVP